MSRDYKQLKKGLSKDNVCSRDHFSAPLAIGRRLGPTLSVDKIIDHMLRAVNEVIVPDVVMFYQREDRHLRFKKIRYHSIKKSCPLDAPDIKRIGECLCGLAASDRKPKFSVDIHKDYRCTLTECKLAGIISFAAVPIVGRKKLIGILSVASYQTRDFKKDKRLLALFADHMSLAMEKALMYEELAKSEERYRTLVEDISLGIALIDTDYRIIMQNKALSRMFGKSSTECVGKKCFREYEKRAAVCDHCPSVAAMAKGVPVEVETEGVRDDGSRFVARIMNIPIHGQDNQVTGFIDVVEDITKRKEFEYQLERSKKRLQTFFDGITEPMFMTAVDGNIVLANRAAMGYCHHCNFPVVIGRNINEILSPHYDIGEKIPTALGSSSQTSFVLKRKQLQKSIDRFFIYPVLINGRDTGEDIIRIVNVTKEKVLEQQLIHTEKLAALGLLVAGISHEINNPNNFITFNIPILRTYLEAILPIVDDYAATQSNFGLFDMKYSDFRKDILNLIDDVEQGAQRISSIVNGLKDFSRKGNLEERSLISPLKLVERVISMCKSSTAKGRINMSAIEENVFPILNLPIGICEQVLVNLIINAVHAADKDQAYVTITIKQGLTWADHLTFMVKDNGKGMDEHTRARIFDPFFTLKPRGEGTGLGLYISKMLVNKLGGDITCASTLGEGSVFTVTIPKGVLGIDGTEGA